MMNSTAPARLCSKAAADRPGARQFLLEGGGQHHRAEGRHGKEKTRSRAGHRDAKLRARIVRLTAEPRHAAERVQDDLLRLYPFDAPDERVRQFVTED